MNLQLDYDSVGSKERNNEDTFEDIVLQLERYDKEGGDGGNREGIEADEHEYEKGIYCTIIEREEEDDNMVQIPTNHGYVGYVENIKEDNRCNVYDPSTIILPSIPDDWKSKKANTAF